MRLAAMISSRVACGCEKRDVLSDRAVEKKIVLQHHAELTAIIPQSHRCKVATVHVYLAREWPIESHHQTNQVSILPEPLEPTSAVVEPAGAVKGHVLQDRRVVVVFKTDVFECQPHRQSPDTVDDRHRPRLQSPCA